MVYMLLTTLKNSGVGSHTKVDKRVGLPFVSFCRTSITSSLPMVSSLLLWPMKAYSALYVSFFDADGGGGGGALAMEEVEWFRL